MKHGVYALFDSAASAYLAPFTAPRDEVARRGFTEAVNNLQPGNNLANYPQDYTLFRLGSFDDSNGLFECEQPGPQAICTGLAVRRSSAESTNQEANS